MTILAVLVSLTALGFAVLALVDQRVLHRRIAAWQRRDGAAGGLSAGRSAAGRAAWLVLAGLFTFGAVQAWNAVDVTSLGDAEARSILDEAASDLEAQPHLRSPSEGTFESAVGDAVQRAATESDNALLPVTSLTRSDPGGGVERYTVTMDEAAFRFCLVVLPSESEEGGVGVPGVGDEPGTSVPAYDLATEVAEGGCGS